MAFVRATSGAAEIMEVFTSHEQFLTFGDSFEHQLKCWFGILKTRNETGISRDNRKSRKLVLEHQWRREKIFKKIWIDVHPLTSLPSRRTQRFQTTCGQIRNNEFSVIWQIPFALNHRLMKHESLVHGMPALALSETFSGTENRYREMWSVRLDRKLLTATTNSEPTNR